MLNRVILVQEVPMGIPVLRAPRDQWELLDILVKLDCQDHL